MDCVITPLREHGTYALLPSCFGEYKLIACRLPLNGHFNSLRCCLSRWSHIINWPGFNVTMFSLHVCALSQSFPGIFNSTTYVGRSLSFLLFLCICFGQPTEVCFGHVWKQYLTRLFDETRFSVAEALVFVDYDCNLKGFHKAAWLLNDISLCWDSVKCVAINCSTSRRLVMKALLEVVHIRFSFKPILVKAM